MELEEKFSEYRSITLAIIEIVNVEEYEKLDEFFKQRQLLLDSINKLDCSKEELKRYCEKYEIDKLDNKLEKEMKKKKDDLLIKIKENQKRKMAMNGYNNLQTKAVFLSKEF